MAQDATPLSEDERRELEELRAQKRAREEAEQARKDREELERLRVEQARAASANQRTSGTPNSSKPPSQEELRVRAARDRGKKLMEPGDDLSMPLGQKLVLVAVFLMVIGFVVAIICTRR